MKATSILLSSVLMGTSLLSVGISQRVLAQADSLTPAPSSTPITPGAPSAPSAPADAPTGGGSMPSAPGSPADAPSSTPSAPSDPSSAPSDPSSTPPAPVESPSSDSKPSSDTPNASSEPSPSGGGERKSALAICGPGGAAQIIESANLPVGCHLVPTDSVPAGQV